MTTQTMWQAAWVQSFVVPPNLRIVLSGRYPDARYASFNVYTGGGSTFTSNSVGSAPLRRAAGR